MTATPQATIDEAIKLYDTYGSNTEVAKIMGVSEGAVRRYRALATKPKKLVAQEEASPYAIQHGPSIASLEGPAFELISRPDDTFCFGAFGDLHAASKYCRWDVRQDLYRLAEEAEAQCVFDTGNWIEGECRFNAHEIVTRGLDEQCRLLAATHPKSKLPTYAIWGDDHEGWYASREGIDVGRYNEAIMREAGHKWFDLGFMEAHVVLTNFNSGKKAILGVVHPGGGSAYALSYAPQKIIESYEGGEKPHVVLYGHYHKLMAAIIRNVMALQTGCAQDQTSFMRKKRIEAHVGGIIVKLTQDPRTGAIIGMQPDIRRYFNLGYYPNKRWSKHGKVRLPSRSLEAIR